MGHPVQKDAMYPRIKENYFGPAMRGGIAGKYAIDKL
jgi:hypothetical protein